MKKWLLLAALVLTLTGCAAKPKAAQVTINQRVIRTELALTDQEQYQGLSGRDSLQSGQGMLFVFSHPGTYQFVMRNMKFPLDIIWINDAQVSYIAKNLPPDGADFKHYYGPDSDAEAVLEVNAGTADLYGWQTGQAVNIKYDF